MKPPSHDINPLSHGINSLSREVGEGEGEAEGERVASQHPHPPSIRFSAWPRSDGEGFLASIRRHAARREKAQREGEPSFGRYLAQVGVLGWTIVIPTLLGMFCGRWVDRRLGTGIFWTGPLLLVGLAVGCWGAWRWMHRP